MTDADNHAAIRAEVERRDARIATLKARCALAGFELMVIGAADGTSVFTVARWGRTVDLPDASAVECWLDRIGAPQ